MIYKAVIFDLFGTLVDNFTLPEYEGILKEMAFILNTPENEFRKLWSASFNDRVTGVHGDQRDSIAYICRSLGITVSTTQVDRAFGVRLDYSARFLMKPKSGAIETLTNLRNDGYKTGLISDCTGEVPFLWQETPFSLLFDAAIFSCKARIKKPDPRIYYMATDKLGVEPRDCIYIGDGSSKELTGASNVGMYPVLIRDPHESVDAHYIEREDDWSGARISSLKEVLDLVE
jgi:putative hydrolase of the HAD superfamily